MQEHESSVFLSFFKQGIRYVEPLQLKEQVNLREEDYPTKLYHLKVRVTPKIGESQLRIRAPTDIYVVGSKKHSCQASWSLPQNTQ